MNNFFYLLICILILAAFKKSYNIGKALGVLSYPDKYRKFHKKPVPQVGGVILFFTFIILAILDKESFLLTLNNFTKGNNINNFFFLFSLISLFLIGLIDDRNDLSPYTKLILLGIVTSTLLISASTMNIKFIKLSFYRTVDLLDYSGLVGIFFLIIFINAMNMFDGINLQSSLLFFTIYSYILFYLRLDTFILVILIFLIIFSFFNYKDKVFLGDSGVYFLTILSFLYLSKIYQNEKLNISFDEILILNILPIVDFLRVTLYRIIKKKNPFLSDRKHFHHLLLKKFTYKISIGILSIGILAPILIYKIFDLGFLISFVLFSFYYCFFILYKNSKLR